MSARQIAAGLLALSILASGPVPAGSSPDTSPVPPVPPAPAGAHAPVDSTDTTPPRVSYINGQVSFWRPGADDWTPAKLNTPLAPGDVLYAGPDGNVEIQIGPRAFVRAAEGTQLGLDNQEPDFLQLRVTGGLAALDVRELAAGDTVEIGTPNAVFTIERAGFYRLDVEPDSTMFRTHRGGVATMTPAGGAPAQIATNQQVVLTGVESPRVESGAAPALTAWDRWNYERTDYALGATSTRYVPREVYGAEALDQHGSWRTVESYGAVWVPAGVPAGWVPYSTGRWIWDPRFGWTWLDDAPWGWAPYHYGRWVHVGSYWAWAPGPVVVRPVYSPALVVFLGGGVRVGVGVRPLGWAPLAWGEPVIPWWGRRGFVGVASWHGWGGPRVVNNVVVNRTTTVNVTNINVYRHVTVSNAVVGVSADRFAQHQDRPRRIDRAEARELKPVRGPLDVKPVAESVRVGAGSAARPPAAIQTRPVVATRPPHDVSPRLREQGLVTRKSEEPTAPPRIVPSPSPNRGEWRDRDERRERGQQPATSGAPQAPTPSRQASPPPAPAPTQPAVTRPEPPANRGARDDRHERRERSERSEQRERSSQPATPAAPQAPARPQQASPPPAPAPTRPAAPRPEPPANRGARPDRDERRERSQPATPPATPQAPAPAQPPSPRQPAVVRPEPPANRGERPERNERRERSPQPAPPAASPAPAPSAPPPPRQPAGVRPEPPASRGERPERSQREQAPDRPARVAPAEPGERQERPERSERNPRQGRADRPERGERGQR